MAKRVLFIARFQPFHKGHLTVLAKTVKKGREAVIVIGSSNKNFSLENPLTIAERLEMVRRVIDKEGWEKEAAYILPFPDCPDNLVWTRKLIDSAPPFNLVVSNNSLVEVLFKKAGYKVERPKLNNRENWQGKSIRELVKKNKPWKKFVPSYLLPLLKKFEFEKRLKSSTL